MIPPPWDYRNYDAYGEPEDVLARMNLDPREKLLGRTTAPKVLLCSLGLLLMGVGGLAFNAALILERDVLRHPWYVALPSCLVAALVGLGTCHAGYCLYCRGQRPWQGHSWSGLPYQEGVRQSGAK